MNNLKDPNNNQRVFAKNIINTALFMILPSLKLQSFPQIMTFVMLLTSIPHGSRWDHDTALASLPHPLSAVDLRLPPAIHSSIHPNTHFRK